MIASEIPPSAATMSVARHDRRRGDQDAPPLGPRRDRAGATPSASAALRVGAARGALTSPAITRCSPASVARPVAAAGRASVSQALELARSGRVAKSR